MTASLQRNDNTGLQHPEWARDAALYQINTRQFTSEGTLRAAEKTIEAVTALHGLGRQHDVALLGFDEVPFSETLSPSVAVITQDPYEMGRRAGTLLLDRLAGRPAPRLQPTVVDAHVHLRESANIRPGGTPP